MPTQKVAYIKVVVKDLQAKDDVIDYVKKHKSFKKAELLPKSDQAKSFALEFAPYKWREIVRYTKWIRDFEPVESADSTVRAWPSPETLARLAAAGKVAGITFIGVMTGTTGTDVAGMTVTLESLSINLLASSVLTALFAGGMIIFGGRTSNA